MLKSQVELEESCSELGYARLMADCEEAEAKGRASGSFYAKHLLEKYVTRATELIQAEWDAPAKPGRSEAARPILKRFKPGQIAYISVVGALNMLMQQYIKDPNRIQTTVLRTQIGTALYNEEFCTLFQKASPDLFHTLTVDLDRRQSKASRHRMTVFRMQAEKNGIKWKPWTSQEIQQCGSWCVDMLVNVNMIELVKVREGAKTIIMMHFTDECLELIENTKKIVSFFRPMRTPFVEQPLDWKGICDGGYHTRRMQNTFARCIKVSPTQLEVIKKQEKNFIPTVIKTINILQSVQWAVNRRVLDVQQALHREHQDKDDIPPLSFHDRDKETWSEDQMAEHKAWCKLKARQYSDNKARRYESVRKAVTLSMAREFAQYPEIYFLYFADWRGRYYPLTAGISPQGPDNQKGLLHAAYGKGLHTPAAVRHFLLLGSAKFGFDKESTDERVRWVRDNEELILAVANEPLVYTEYWTKADKPYQFLAWCFEYADWKKDPSGFVSRLPCSLDGTCNGIQHYSAMFRDEVGAKATNLVNALKPNDVYGQVAGVVTELLKKLNVSDSPLLLQNKGLSVFELEDFRTRWLDHGINRKLTKRCVMTLPYGSKKFSMGRFIRDDYLAEFVPNEFGTAEYNEVASFLGYYVWDAIGQVAVKAIEGMNYFQSVSRCIMRKKGAITITWTAMTGLPIVQSYWKTEYVQFRSKQLGSTKLNILRETDEVDKLGHTNGIAPNVIHSCDASHLTFTALEASRRGMGFFAFVHDDYGTLAADTEEFALIIREQFRLMYLMDPFKRIADELEAQTDGKNLPARPEYGTFDLDEVLHAEHFFG